MALIYNALSVSTFVPAMLYMQHVGHVGRSTMGLVFIPALLASFLFARLVPMALQRFPARAVAVAGCGFYTLQVIPTMLGNGVHAGPGLAFGCALAAILCSTFGSVTGVITVFTEGTGSAPPDQRGIVSALLLSTSQLGAAVGLAIGASTLAMHGLGGTENFVLTSFTVAGIAVASGVLCLAWFRPRV
jgi:MFS family permease